MSTKPVLLHFKFDNFVILPSVINSSVLSEIVTDSNGNRWRLELLPGGAPDSKTPGLVGVYLFCHNEKSNDARLSFAIKDANGGIFKERTERGFFGQDNNSGYGWPEAVERSLILDPSSNILRNGALFVDVTIQVLGNKEELYQPQSILSKNMLNLLESEEGSDVEFNVNGNVIRAHSLILRANSPVLANYCNDPMGSEVKVEFTSPEVFKFVLRYVYAGCYPSDGQVLKFGKELINAANKYELVELKMAVENVLVRERVLDKRNVADFILFADAQSCPLLKEYAISFFTLHAKEVLKSDASKSLRDSAELLSEIIMLTTGGDEEENTMTVTELRKELGKRKMDVDGSKDTLYSRLEEAKRQRTE